MLGYEPTYSTDSVLKQNMQNIDIVPLNLFEKFITICPHNKIIICVPLGIQGVGRYMNGQLKIGKDLHNIDARMYHYMKIHVPTLMVKEFSPHANFSDRSI